MSTPPKTQTPSSRGSKSPDKHPAKSPSRSSRDTSPSVGDPNILSASHWQQLAEDEGVIEDDGDSLTGQSLSSSTDSVTSSIFEYRKLHGRTFHHEIGSAQYWDFADEYPNAEVIGTDISPIEPFWVPPNLKFEIEDCTQEWTFAPNSADHIHIRWLIGSIPDWNQLFREAYKTCKPGGWVESFEPSSPATTIL
ncbi:Ff.00g062560.m01.CDS01 [Fusarium sp. VM40]|nr:Ff.00g062560.m01.CDS01 [Fusarium sp. VM40]